MLWYYPISAIAASFRKVPVAITKLQQSKVPLPGIFSIKEQGSQHRKVYRSTPQSLR